MDPNSLQLAKTIIQSRVDSLGVGESEVTTSGDNQIIVTVPNVQQDELVQAGRPDRGVAVPSGVCRRTGTAAGADAKRNGQAQRGPTAKPSGAAQVRSSETAKAPSQPATK